MLTRGNNMKALPKILSVLNPNPLIVNNVQFNTMQANKIQSNNVKI
jgi:hypothetical protein